MTETTVAVAPLNFFPDVHAIWPNTMLSCTVAFHMSARAIYYLEAAAAEPRPRKMRFCRLGPRRCRGCSRRRGDDFTTK